MNNDLAPVVENSPSPSNKFTNVASQNELKVTRLFDQLPDLLKVYVTLKANNTYWVRFHNMDPLVTKNVTLKYKY